ncbi:MAG: hypothetical protein JNJ91_09560 [Flavobacteriales bacterium]|nr:hypothetical protein [Flavobacteriales bacterium]
MPRLIACLPAGRSTVVLSLVPQRFLVSMAVSVCGPLAQAQIDSGYIITVDRRVQAINAEKDAEVRTLENDAFFEYTTDGGGFSNYRPETSKAAPAFQILVRLAHQATIKKRSGCLSVG